ncbi:hypothetical protein RCL1_003319 [Eukaryota sp. TZLM3-RCL]
MGCTSSIPVSSHIDTYDDWLAFQLSQSIIGSLLTPSNSYSYSSSGFFLSKQQSDIVWFLSSNHRLYLVKNSFSLGDLYEHSNFLSKTDDSFSASPTCPPSLKEFVSSSECDADTLVSFNAHDFSYFLSSPLLNCFLYWEWNSENSSLSGYNLYNLSDSVSIRLKKSPDLILQCRANGFIYSNNSLPIFSSTPFSNYPDFLPVGFFNKTTSAFNLLCGPYESIVTGGKIPLGVIILSGLGLFTPNITSNFSCEYFKNNSPNVISFIKDRIAGKLSSRCLTEFPCSFTLRSLDSGTWNLSGSLLRKPEKILPLPGVEPRYFPIWQWIDSIQALVLLDGCYCFSGIAWVSIFEDKISNQNLDLNELISVVNAPICGSSRRKVASVFNHLPTGDCNQSRSLPSRWKLVIMRDDVEIPPFLNEFINTGVFLSYNSNNSEVVALNSEEIPYCIITKSCVNFPSKQSIPILTVSRDLDRNPIFESNICESCAIMDSNLIDLPDSDSELEFDDSLEAGIMDFNHFKLIDSLESRSFLPPLLKFVTSMYEFALPQTYGLPKAFKSISQDENLFSIFGDDFWYRLRVCE